MASSIRPPAWLSNGGADAAQMIAEERVIDAVAVGIVAVGVVAVIALEQDVMRTHHMAGVEPGLDPGALVLM